MRTHIIEALESRRLLTADIAVGLKSTNAPATLVVGQPLVPTASVTVANLGDALAKTDTDVTVTVALRSASGQITTLTTRVLKAASLKAKPTTVAFKVVIPPNLAPGTYDLIASATGPADANTANDSVTLKTFTANPANADVIVTGTTTLAGTITSGTTGKATVLIRNNGNVTAKTTGKIEILSAINGVTTVVGLLDNVSVNLAANKFLTSKPISFTLNSSTTASVTSLVSARFTPTTPLSGDITANNTSPIGSFSIGAPPPSPLDGTNLPKTITFKSKQYKVFGGLGFESGDYKAANGAEGTYYMTIGTGISNGGTSFSFTTVQTQIPIMILHPKSGLPKWGSRTITFGVDQAGASGYVELGAGGKVIYYK